MPKFKSTNGKPFIPEGWIPKPVLSIHTVDNETFAMLEQWHINFNQWLNYIKTTNGRYSEIKIDGTTSEG